MTLDIVAFDIETTGFTVADEVTVAGFALDMGARVFYQTGGRQPESVERAVRDEAAHNVHVSVHESERELLDAMAAFVTGRLADQDVLVVAYNGETWRGGFDLPFLRTRLAVHDVAWPFTDVAYGDLLPVITDRFNTTVPDPDASDADGDGAVSDGAGTAPGADGGDDDASDATRAAETGTGTETVTRRDLDAVYETLCGGRFGDIDPFADSAAAVEAFHDARFDALVLHNVADILRTRALGLLAERYCSKSDFSVKSMTAVQDTRG